MVNVWRLAFNMVSWDITEPPKPFIFDNLLDGAFRIEGLSDIVILQSVPACRGGTVWPGALRRPSSELRL